MRLIKFLFLYFCVLFLFSSCDILIPVISSFFHSDVPCLIILPEDKEDEDEDEDEETAKEKISELIGGLYENY